MGAGGRDERGDVPGIGGEDLVQVGGGEEHDRCVDDVACTRSGQQHPRPPAEVLVEGYDVDAGEEPGENGLTRTSAAPDLSHDAAVGPWHASRPTLALDDGDHVAVPALDRDQRSCIEDDGQAAGRTVIARARMRLVVSAISVPVKAPCSAS